MTSDTKACFSSKLKYRAVIRYLFQAKKKKKKKKKKQQQKKKKKKKKNIYAPSDKQVQFWSAKFKWRRTSGELEAGLGAHYLPTLRKCAINCGISYIVKYCDLDSGGRESKDIGHFKM